MMLGGRASGEAPRAPKAVILTIVALSFCAWSGVAHADLGEALGTATSGGSSSPVEQESSSAPAVTAPVETVTQAATEVTTQAASTVAQPATTTGDGATTQVGAAASTVVQTATESAAGAAESAPQAVGEVVTTTEAVAETVTQTVTQTAAPTVTQGLTDVVERTRRVVNGGTTAVETLEQGLSNTTGGVTRTVGGVVGSASSTVAELPGRETVSGASQAVGAKPATTHSAGQSAAPVADSGGMNDTGAGIVTAASETAPAAGQSPFSTPMAVPAAWDTRPGGTARGWWVPPWDQAASAASSDEAAAASAPVAEGRRSSPGWPTAPDRIPSPIGALSSAAASAGAGALVLVFAALAAACFLAVPRPGRRLRPDEAPWRLPILALSLERPG